MMPPVELREWETIEVPLSPEGARCLAEVAGSRLTVGVGPNAGTWLVTASSHVGVFVTPEVELLVHPKVPMHNLFQMLDVGLPADAFDRNTFSFGSDRSLLAAIAQIFARSVERATGNGLIRAYRLESDRLHAIRGRININEVVRRPGMAIPIPCTFDEYTADIFENRVLRAAVQRLLRVPGVRPRTRRTLSHALSRFEEVIDGPVDVGAIERIVFTRLNRHYRQPLALASLILRNLSLIDRVGSEDASAFTVDMNILFETWITDRLERHLWGRLRVSAQSKEHLGVGRKIPMRPDLEFRRGTELVYVGDVKYKLTSSGLGRNADYYQLLAYTTALGLDEGLLIYCQSEGTVPDRDVVVRNAGTSLRTHAVDLSGMPEEAEAAVAALAELLRARVDAQAGELHASGAVRPAQVASIVVAPVAS